LGPFESTIPLELVARPALIRLAIMSAWIAVLVVEILVIAGMATAAEAEDALACPPDPNAAQAPIIGNPVLDETSGLGTPNTTLTAAEVTDLAGTHALHKVNYGLTRRDNILDADVELEARRDATGEGICFWVSKIKLTFTPVHVFIANDLSPDSCAYRAVWSHERVHVRKFHELDLKFRTIFKDAIRRISLPSAGKPEHFPDLKAGADALLARMNVAVNAVLGAGDPAIRQRLDTGDRMIWYESGNPFPRGTYFHLYKEHVDSWDSDVSYQKVLAECADWPH